LFTGLQFDSPSSQPFGITKLKLATLPLARSELKVIIPSADVPAGMSFARHSPYEMSVKSIGGLPVV
jgi:hypothetical protein